MSSARKSEARTERLGRAGWLGWLVLGTFLVFVYLINGRQLTSDDTFSATVLPLNILRGEGLYLENQYRAIVGADFPLPYYWVRSRGHIVTLYPIAPALVALPLVAPQAAVLDLCRPGWDRDHRFTNIENRMMVKRSMTVIVALAGVVLHRLLVALGLRQAALPAALAACLGSDLWSVASQAAWQHGPAALSLVAAMALLHPQPVSRGRLALAGLATAFLFTCRLMDVVFAAAIVVWLAWTDRRPLPVVPAGPDRRRSDFARLQSVVFWHDPRRASPPRAASPFFARSVRHVVDPARRWALGTLLSPNRGLLVFSPWIAVAIASLAVPAVRRRLSAHSLICVLLASLVPYLLILSKYSVWWGGHCFGPRYWTDVVPLFAILFAFGLDWMLTRSRALVAISAATVVFSIAVQLIGAFCYPSSWNMQPSNVDFHHERLWDWRDTELSRCWIEFFRK